MQSLSLSLSQCKEGGAVLGGGGTGSSAAHRIRTPLPSCTALHWAAQIGTSHFAGADQSSSTAVAGPLFRLRKKYPLVPSCRWPCMFQGRLALGCEWSYWSTNTLSSWLVGPAFFFSWSSPTVQQVSTLWISSGLSQCYLIVPILIEKFSWFPKS